MNSTDEIKEKINKIIEMVNNSEISSIKQTVTQIISTIIDPDSSAKDLKKIIETDPPLAAKLLKLANSAFYGFPRTISAIHEAIVCIGFEAVRELALNQKVCEIFKKADYINGYSRISLWRHSVAVAVCCKLIYRREFRERGENIYVAGLLHDIGIIVFDQFLHHDFLNILRKSRSEKNNLLNTENAILHFNHADIGRAIAENWDFPVELVKAIGNHHDAKNVDDKYAKISFTTYIADYAVQDKLIGYCDAPNKNKTLFLKCLKKLNIKEKAIGLIVKEVEKEINKMEKSEWFQYEKK